MSYRILKSDGSTLVEISDNTVDTTACSLTLLGQGTLYYGSEVAQDLVRLLENFANVSSPANPVKGQLWYDTSGVPNILKIFTTNGWSVLSTQLGPGGMIPNGTTLAGNPSLAVRTSGVASICLFRGPLQTSVAAILSEGRIVAIISHETIPFDLLPTTITIEGTVYDLSVRFPDGLFAGQTLATDVAHYVYRGVLQTPPSFVPTSGQHGTDKNYVDGIKNYLEALITSLTQNLSTSNLYLVPTGGIIMWSGALDHIPVGWGLCDGSTYNKQNGVGTIVSPNMKNKFVVGAGEFYGVGDTGGGIAHNHTITTNDHVLTVDEIPSHQHTVTEPLHTHVPTVVDSGHVHQKPITGSGYMIVDHPGGNGIYGSMNHLEDFGWSPTTGNGAANITASIAPTKTNLTVDFGGGNGHAHQHTAQSENTDGRPPYFALAYIIKL